MPTYIRCRDPITGHQFDVDERSLRPGVEPVPGYPPNSGPGAQPRPARHFTGKDGKPSAPRRPTPAVTSPPTTPEGDAS